MEGQRSFCGFRLRKAKLPNLSPERASKESKYETWGLRRSRVEPGEGNFLLRPLQDGGQLPWQTGNRSV